MSGKAAAGPEQAETAERRLSAVVPYEGMLMAFGGHDGEGFLTSAETFIPGRASWRSEADMMQGRAHFASCILNGRVWAMGGWDPYGKERMHREGSDSKALSTVEIFDPRQGSWSIGPKLVSSRAFHGALALDDSIYVIGGSPPVACIISITVQHCKGHRLLRT